MDPSPVPNLAAPAQPPWRVWAAGVAVTVALIAVALWGVHAASRWWADNQWTRELDTERARTPLQTPDGLVVPVTISVGGVTSTDPSATAASVLAQADAALYAAKAAGRDGVRWTSSAGVTCPAVD
ncbi:MAG: diguanylate cyclase [Pseudomonadota bacterium]